MGAFLLKTFFESLDTMLSFIYKLSCFMNTLTLHVHVSLTVEL